MKDIELKKATINDIHHLQKIGTKTFFETFSSDNSPEDMEQYLHEKFSLEKLTAELNDDNCSFYFAEQDSEVVGYLKLNSGQSQTELKHEKSVEIERIYVLKEFHGKKAGELLLKKAIQAANEAKVEFVWLGVWEQNQRAIAFYKKNGFVEFDKHIFRLGDSVQTDIMMKLQIEGIDEKS